MFMGERLGTFLFVAWGCEVADVAAACTQLGTNSRALRSRLGHSAMQGSSVPAISLSRGASCSWLMCAWDTSPSWLGRVSLGTSKAWGAAKLFIFMCGLATSCKALVPRGETGDDVVECGGFPRGCWS